MTSLFIVAFMLGGFGSMHCIGMCGPLALSLPIVANNYSSKFISTLLYNSGRIVTYAFLGAIFGLIGMSFSIFGYQQWLSIILGILILVFLFLPKNHTALKINYPIYLFFEKTRASFGRLFYRNNYRSVFFIGLLNGLLPCGLIYLAIAGAISTASLLKSSLFMAAFGLGTLPVMWSIAFLGSFMNMRLRFNLSKLFPYVMALVAILLIIRGLGLQIPYVSPVLNLEHSVKPTLIQCYD